MKLSFIKSNISRFNDLVIGECFVFVRDYFIPEGGEIIIMIKTNHHSYMPLFKLLEPSYNISLDDDALEFRVMLINGNPEILRCAIEMKSEVKI